MRVDALVPRARATAAAPAGAAEAARRFEALVLERLLEPATRPLFAKGALGGGGAGSTLPRQLFAAEVAGLAAARGGLGLARAFAGAADDDAAAAGAHERAGTAAAREGGAR